VVIAVLSLVAAAITPQLIGRFNNAKARTAQLHVNTLAAAMDDFFIDTGRYPTADEGLRALVTAPGNAPGWRGPYVRSEQSLIDPWGRPFILSGNPSPTGAPLVMSLGADGAEGGSGVDSDVTSS
jgi:general secretion pathway protein G